MAALPPVATPPAAPSTSQSTYPRATTASIFTGHHQCPSATAVHQHTRGAGAVSSQLFQTRHHRPRRTLAVPCRKARLQRVLVALHCQCRVCGLKVTLESVHPCFVRHAVGVRLFDDPGEIVFVPLITFRRCRRLRLHARLQLLANARSLGGARPAARPGSAFPSLLVILPQSAVWELRSLS